MVGLPICAMKAKSFMVPSRLRLRVRPKATFDIRARSSAMAAAGTPTAARTSHTASGNIPVRSRASRIGMTTGRRDRSLMNSRC